jgi:Ca2+-binding RTX toxin-like protein
MSGLGISVEDDRQANVTIVGSRSGFPHYRPETASLGVLTGFSSSIAGTEGDDFLLGTGGDDKITGQGGNDQIFGKAGNDLLIGGQGDDILIGNRGSDELRGGMGNDHLDGGLGLDYMTGHAGDDIYIIDNRGDRVIEAQGGGHDLIGTYISLTMPLWVEDIIALEDAPINLVGNRIGNLMVGNSNDNVIKGRAGADTLVGEAGNDVLIGNAGADILVGSSGDDSLSGGNGRDILDGGSGNDLLKGGKGMDILYGGSGDDSLYGNQGPDILFGGEGNNIFRGGKGSDHFMVEFPGSQFNIVLDFDTGEKGDRIVIAEDVLDVNLSNSILEKYIQMKSASGPTIIAIDQDGGGDSFVTVMQLDNLAGLPASSLVVADDGSLTISLTG